MGDYWYLYVLPIIGGIIWWLLSSALVRAPGNLLQKKFRKTHREYKWRDCRKNAGRSESSLRRPERSIFDRRWSNAISMAGNRVSYCACF